MEIKNVAGNVIFSSSHPTLKETLERAVKSGADLSGANLSFMDLREVDLTGAILREENLSGIKGQRTIFKQADLSGANLREARLNRARFQGANLTDAKIGGSFLSGSYMKGAIVGDMIIDELPSNMSPIELITGRYSVTIFDEHLTLSCQLHGIKAMFNYSDRDIIRMDGKRSLKWWRKWKETIKLICETGGRNV